MQEAQNRRAVVSLVRAADRDRYLSALFAPEGARDALLALAAFNVELSRIAEIVSEAMLGEIRLQWWRDTLERSGGGMTGNPVADALLVAVKKHDLPRPLLLGLVDARTFDVSGGIMPDMQALKAYLNKTAGTLFLLSARILGSDPHGADTSAREAGLAYGLTGLLRNAPLHRARGRIYLPMDRLADQGLSPEDLFLQEKGESARAIIADLVVEARAALERARIAVAELPGDAGRAFLPLALVEPYLRALTRRDRDPLRDVADIDPLRRLWRLTRAAMRGHV